MITVVITKSLALALALALADGTRAGGDEVGSEIAKMLQLAVKDVVQT